VDVASGVERQPGQKDPIKLREFVRAAREAFDALAAEALPEDDESAGVYDWQEDS
jgi:hypothetical protein